MAAALAGLFSGSAAAAGTACTVTTSGCEQWLQWVLAEGDPAQIEVSPSQLSIPGFDYVDPNSTTGSEIFDYLSAQEEAGVGPGIVTAEGEMEIAEGAIDFAAVDAAPLSLGVSVVGALAAHYVIKWLWGSFGSSSPVSADLYLGADQDPAGQWAGPEWVFQNNVCGHFGPGYILEWGVKAEDEGDTQWGASYGDRPDALTNANATFNNPGPFEDYSATFCGLPSPAQMQADNAAGSGTWSPQAIADIQGMWDVESQEANTGCDGGPTWIGTGNNPYFPGGVGLDWHALIFGQQQFEDALACMIPQIGPETGTPTVTTTVTAPAPADVSAWPQARSDLQADPALNSTVDEALTDDQATTSTSPTDTPTTPNECDPDTDTSCQPCAPDGSVSPCYPPPGGSSSCNCTFDFAPIESQDFGSNFPFGIVSYLGGVLNAMTVSGAAPSFDITAGHTWHIDLASSTWEDAVRPVLYPVLEFAMAVGAVVFIALRHFRRGTADA